MNASVEGEGPYNSKMEEGLIGHGESDRFIVPEKAGNSAGGKEATRGSAA